jgi:hypothetical protein
MVDFVSTLGVVTSFIANVLSIPFFGFGTFGNFILVCLLLLLVGFVLRGLWDGGDK